MNRSNIIPPLRLVFLMWLTFSLELFLQIDLGYLGVLPRTTQGLIGVFTAPLIHGSHSHLVSNTLPLLVLGTATFFFYPGIAVFVFLQCYVITDLLVWCFGRPFYHIGASGLIYGLATFLIFSGIFRREIWSILISIVVAVLYGWIFFGLIPGNVQVSWESHLFGAMVGGVSAFIYRNKKN